MFCTVSNFENRKFALNCIVSNFENGILKYIIYYRVSKWSICIYYESFTLYVCIITKKYLAVVPCNRSFPEFQQESFVFELFLWVNQKRTIPFRSSRYRCLQAWGRRGWSGTRAGCSFQRSRLDDPELCTSKNNFGNNYVTMHSRNFQIQLNKQYAVSYLLVGKTIRSVLYKKNQHSDLFDNSILVPFPLELADSIFVTPDAKLKVRIRSAFK